MAIRGHMLIIMLVLHCFNVTLVAFFRCVFNFSEKALPERFSELERKQKAKEIERSDKWLKMTKNWDKYMTNTGKHDLVRITQVASAILSIL